MPLRVYDGSISVLRRALDAAKLGRSEKLDGMSRLDAFARGIERTRQPDSDVDAAIARERRLSPAFGGRTVIDDVRERRGGRRPARPRSGQLDLFPK